jgi:hypothetical protein
VGRLGFALSQSTPTSKLSQQNNSRDMAKKNNIEYVGQVSLRKKYGANSPKYN